jgi:hypothetical protein
MAGETFVRENRRDLLCVIHRLFVEIDNAPARRRARRFNFLPCDKAFQRLF